MTSIAMHENAMNIIETQRTFLSHCSAMKTCTVQRKDIIKAVIFLLDLQSDSNQSTQNRQSINQSINRSPAHDPRPMRSAPQIDNLRR